MITIEGTTILSTHQRKGYVAVEDLFVTRDGFGKMLREDIVDNVRHIAVRWPGEGISTYRVLADGPNSRGDGDRYHCALIHSGL